MSTTLLNRDLVHVYGDGNTAGVILTPSAAEVLCAYGNDGGSMMKLCDPEAVEDTQCIPGCHTDSTAAWCTESSIYDCAWRPSDLHIMLRMQMAAPWTYNEVVLGTERWLREPVSTIEAVVFLGRGAAKVAREAHASLVAEFPHAAERIPILRLDLDRLDAPFEPA